jgi:hypothetical protein
MTCRKMAHERHTERRSERLAMWATPGESAGSKELSALLIGAVMPHLQRCRRLAVRVRGRECRFVDS